MTKDRVVAYRAPEGFSPDPLTDFLRQGARQLIAQAVEAEWNGFLAAHAGQTDPAGRRRLVRHGHLPEREVQTGIGAVLPLGQCFALACKATGEGSARAGMTRVRKPSGGMVFPTNAPEGERLKFTSTILPPYPLPGNRCLQR